MASHSRSTLAFLPAVAVGGRRGSLQLAVVALVARARTLSAAAQRVSQTTSPAFENILQI
jgi:hypothetical protein